jgi:hypothetical protein
MIRALLNTKPGIWPAEPIDPSMPYKSMTRRVIKPRYRRHGEAGFEVWLGLNRANVKIVDGEGFPVRNEYPRYLPGDILYVREMWRVSAVGSTGNIDTVIIEYKTGDTKAIDITADRVPYYAGKANWRPSIFMPREAARLFLEVKNVRVEKLQNISEKDAEAEGVIVPPLPTIADPVLKRRMAFSALWDGLNEERGYPWEGNPWVWVYEFMRIDPEEAKEETL